MHNRLSRSAVGVALAGAALTLAGCQTYQPEPLDLEAHREAWLQRTPADEPVRALAERLATIGRPAAFDPSDGLSLAEGETVALVFNPDLRLARLRAGVASATAEHAGLWSDPVFSIDVLRITESVADPWVVTPGLGFTIPISGRLEAEKDRADAALAAELARIAEQEWETRVTVRRAWLRWSAASVRAQQTERLLESVASLTDSTSQLADAGEMVRTEAALFEIEAASQRQALLRFRGEAAEAEQRLRALLGLSPAAPLDLVPTLTAGEPSPASPADMSPTLARLRAEYDVAEKSLRREIRKQYPDLTIGPLYETDQGQSRVGFFGAIPVPLLNANKQGIAEARAQRELARAAYETAFERLVGALARTRSRLDALTEQRRVLETELVPLVDRQLADARRLLELGEGGALVLLESLRRVGRTRLELIDARLGESLAKVDLAALVGPPSSSPNAEPTNAGPAPQPDRQTDEEVTP